jgi:hypothetical protein
MIAMEVGDQDGANRVRIDSEFAHGDHRGSATVHEEGSPLVPNMEASVEATAASEGIAGTQKLDFYTTLPSMRHKLRLATLPHTLWRRPREAALHSLCLADRGAY